MAEPTPEQVDHHLEHLLLGDDPAAVAALQASDDGGLPPIAVSALQATLLELLVRISGARRVLEVGTLGGYSALHLARGLDGDGVVVSLEVDPHHAEVARANLEAAGLSEHVEVLVGAGVNSLDEMIAEGAAPFDLAFVDADKESYPLYLERVLSLSRPGTVLVFDNMVRQGRILDAASGDAMIEGTRRALELIGAEPRLEATAIQTVGTKGWDGFVLARVR
jgi:predicted O-methyltransferase YrrM